MKYQIMAAVVTAFFGGAIAWIKLNGGKISSWLRVISSVTKFGADLNDACSDGKASSDEMQKLCTDYNQLLADLGLLKQGVKK